MKIRHLQIATLAMPSVLVMVLALTSTAQTSESCAETVLPNAAKELLRTKFPSWRPKQISDLDADVQQLWLKAHEKECPGIAAGHFERGDRPAYAVLLVPKTKPDGGYQLIVLTAPQAGKGYTAKVLDHAEGQAYSGLVISKLGPGKYSDFEDTKSVQLKLDSVHLEWIEKGAQVFYWSGGRYHKLQISD